MRYFTDNLSVEAAAVSENTGDIISEQTVTEDGLTIIDKVIQYPVQTRSSARTRTADHYKAIYSGDTLIAEITFRATFSYDGSSVFVVYKSVIQTDTYSGWTYTQQSFTSSGGTVTLEGKLRKLLVMNIPFTMGLTCDVNGNITAI